MQLIDLVTRDYNTMSAEDFEKCYDECRETFEETKQKTDAEEEEKMQDDFMEKLALENAQGKHLNPKNLSNSNQRKDSRGVSPRGGGKKLGKKPKK